MTFVEEKAPIFHTHTHTHWVPKSNPLNILPVPPPLLYLSVAFTQYADCSLERERPAKLLTEGTREPAENASKVNANDMSASKSLQMCW